MFGRMTASPSSKDDAYKQYLDFSKEQRDWKPDVKSVWSKKVRELLGPCVQRYEAKTSDFRSRVRAFRFAPLGRLPPPIRASCGRAEHGVGADERGG